MKRCPQCKVDYFDDMLEFCLDDGVRLVPVNDARDEFPTVTKAINPRQTDAETVSLAEAQFPKPAAFVEARAEKVPQTFQESDSAAGRSIETKIPAQGLKALEIAPLVLSLAHNWWQWIYLDDQYYSSFSQYVFSANFLMWLLLLLVSAVISLFSLKHSRNKAFAYTGLVILAINLILFLVPKR